MGMLEREVRLMEAFVSLLADHQKDFEGFVRDIENLRYCHVPIDSQQLGRCEYALQNMEIRLLTLQNCIQKEVFSGEVLESLVTTRNAWISMKARVDTYLREIQDIIDSTLATLRPARRSLNSKTSSSF